MYIVFSQLLAVLLLFVNFRWISTTDCTSNNKYEGDVVLSLEFGNFTNYTVIHEKIAGFVHQYSENKMNVWSESLTSCQIQVSKSAIENMKEFCKRSNITVKVLVKDLKKAIKEQFEENQKERKCVHCKRGHKFNYNAFNTFEDIQTELHRIASQNSHLVQFMEVGNSFEGRPLYLLKISEDVNSNIYTYPIEYKPIIWVDGGAHAREWISIATAMKFIRQLVEGYGKDPKVTKLLRFNTVYVAPVFNPDGYVYSWEVDRLWRKTRTCYGNLKCVGADVNRNWNVFWGGAGSSNDSCSDVFHGIHPESEPCVQTYAEILRMKKGLLKSYWSLHSFGQLILVPRSYTTELPPDINNIGDVALAFRNAARETNQQKYGAASPAQVSGPQTGTAPDYVHVKFNLSFSFIIELRPSSSSAGGFLLPPNQIEPAYREFYNGFMAASDKIDEINSKKENNKCFNKNLIKNIIQYLFRLLSLQ